MQGSHKGFFLNKLVQKEFCGASATNLIQHYQFLFGIKNIENATAHNQNASGQQLCYSDLS